MGFNGATCLVALACASLRLSIRDLTARKLSEVLEELVGVDVVGATNFWRRRFQVAVSFSFLIPRSGSYDNLGQWNHLMQYHQSME